MGLECSRPSRDYTELYLPADTFRVCDPRHGSCWCDRGHHRNSRYFYVERGGDGRERLHDPFDYMDRFMTGGGWPMPWKDVRDWTTRDYDQLGEIMAEYNNRLSGRQLNTWSSAAPWMNSMLPAMLMADEMRSSRYPRRYKSGRGSSQSEFMRYAQEIARDHANRIRAVENELYGSEKELREEQYINRQAKLWDAIMARRQQMSANVNGANGVGGTPGMMYPNNPIGGGGMMPQHYPQYPYGTPGISTPGMNPMGPMGPNGMMPGGGGYGGGMNPMNGYPHGMPGGGLGGGLGPRDGFGRAGRRRVLPMGDDLDDDFGDLLGGRSRRRPGSRRWGDRDLDDDLRGLDGSDSPRPTRGPRRGPTGPDDLLGGGGGGAGVAFDDEATRNIYPSRPLYRRDSPERRMPSAGVDRAYSPAMDSRASSPLPGRPSRPQPTTMPPSAEHMYTRIPPAGAMPARSRPPYPGVDGAGFAPHGIPQPEPYMSGARGPRPVRQDGNRFNVGQAGLARPREEEENRGEPEAGGTADRRDAEPR